MPSKCRVSVSRTPVEVLQSNPAGLQSQIPLVFLVSLPDLQSGKLDMGLRTFTTVRELLGIIVLQFVDHSSFRYGIWFYHDCISPTFLLKFLLCLWIWAIFFHVFQYPPVNGCSMVSCDLGPLAEDDCISFYSAILNQSALSHFLKIYFYAFLSIPFVISASYMTDQ